MTAQKNFQFSSPEKSLNFHIDSLLEKVAVVFSSTPMRRQRHFSIEEFAFLSGISTMLIVGWVSFFSAFTLSPSSPRTPTIYHMASNFGSAFSKPFSDALDTSSTAISTIGYNSERLVLGASDQKTSPLFGAVRAGFLKWINGVTGGTLREICPSLYSLDKPSPKFIQEISAFSSKLTYYLKPQAN